MKTYVKRNGGDREVKIVAEFEFNGDQYVIRTATNSPTTMRSPVKREIFERDFQEKPAEKVIRFVHPKKGQEYLSESEGVFKIASGDFYADRWVVVG